MQGHSGSEFALQKDGKDERGGKKSTGLSLRMLEKRSRGRGGSMSFRGYLDLSSSVKTSSVVLSSGEDACSGSGIEPIKTLLEVDVMRWTRAGAEFFGESGKGCNLFRISRLIEQSRNSLEIRRAIEPA